MFTVLTNLALGVVSTLMAQMMAISGLPVGSLIIPGHLMFDNTNNTNIEYVGLQQVVKHTATGPDYITNGTQSGVMIKDNGNIVFGSYTKNCTGTGGSTGLYDTCFIKPLLSSSGSITRITLMVSASPKVVSIDCGFTKAARTATGTVFQNFNNFSTSTGSIVVFGTGSIRWNGADNIKCGTLTDPTASFAAKLKVDYFDETSE